MPGLRGGATVPKPFRQLPAGRPFFPGDARHDEGEQFALAEVLDEVRERDRRDRERKVSPLVRAADAVLVDNTAMGIEETARLIVMLAQERQNETTASAGRKV